ncbi:MAG: fumarate hydratase [Clostridia bacterium]|nr:fumarate hydratase [Clostridia bacterium]
MREIDVKTITDSVEKLCIDANCFLPCDVREKIENALKNETSEVGKGILDKLLENADIAKNKEMPICQDTGMAVIFIDIGQEVHFTGGDLTEAINEGVRRGYINGYLRKSVVADPIRRGNTNDNTPAVIHYNIVSGDKVKITVAPKGFGSENMSALKMLKPAEGLEGVKEFIVDTVKKAGANPCPPIVVGVGIGGTADKCAYLAKKALTRNLNEKNQDPYYSALEDELLEKINNLDIGPQGFGGKTTALKVSIETFATHIAGLPCCVNINCHVTRHKDVII